MKYKVILICSILSVLSGTLLISHHMGQKLCQKWFEDASQQQNKGYYGASIEKLTLYFTDDKCRSAADPEAVELLTLARVKVPLPGNTHLAQQLMLSRYGWQLKRNPAHFLRIASASLTAGDWSQALAASKRSQGSKAALIGLASAIFLQNEKEITEGYDRLAASNATYFQRAIVTLLASNLKTKVKLPGKFTEVPASFRRLAAKTLYPDTIIYSSQDARQIKAQLSDDDLSIASSLLTRSGALILATELLDQPNRPLQASHLNRLANLFWVQEQYQDLSSGFQLRHAKETIPAKALMAVCAASIVVGGRCDPTFNEQDYRQRYGVYAASRWARLLSALAAQNLNPAEIIDQMATMDELLVGSGLAYSIKGQLFELLGEAELATREFRLAETYGFDRQNAFFNQTEKATPCRANNTSCLKAELKKAPSDHTLWRTALNAGLKPTEKEALYLKSISPDAATMWRTVIAQIHLAKQTPADTAAALNLLRPVLKQTPNRAAAQMLAATATARFKDMDAAYLHLANAVKNNPDRTIETLRLTIGFYETNNVLTDSSLVLWWQKLTHLEMVARSTKVQSTLAKRLLIERLSILAEYCETEKRYSLCEKTYEAILATTPTNHMALNNLAFRILARKGDLNRALDYSIQATRAAPQVNEYQKTLKDIQEAIEAEVS